MHKQVTTGAIQKVDDLATKAVDISQRWHDLAVEVTSHVSALIADGHWEQLPDFERQWLEKVVKSI